MNSYKVQGQIVFCETLWDDNDIFLANNVETIMIYHQSSSYVSPFYDKIEMSFLLLYTCLSIHNVHKNIGLCDHQIITLLLYHNATKVANLQVSGQKSYFIKFKSVSNYTNLNWFQFPSLVSIQFRKACETKTNSTYKQK